MVALHNPSWLLSWGQRNSGQDGQGVASASYNLVPTTASVIRLEPGVTISDVEAGLQHTVLLLTNGSVVTYGLNTNGQCGQNSTVDPVLTPGIFILPTGVKAVYIAAKAAFTCVIGDNGSVYCAGSNYNGLFGVNSNNDPVRSPVRTLLPTGEFAVSMAFGENFACIVTTSGAAAKVWCSGWTPNSGIVWNPTQMVLPADFRPVNASGGWAHIW